MQGVDIQLAMHVNDPPSVKSDVSSELEFEGIILGALEQCYRDMG